MSESLESTTEGPLSDDTGAESSSEYRWEDGGLPLELQRGMENLRVNLELTDVTVCVQGHEFPCHRAVLAAASQYFRAMFCSGLKESHEGRVEIKGLDSGTMQTLLQYTYTSQALLTQANVQKVLEAASQFQFLRVVDACVAYLSKSLQPETCIGILNLAEPHALPALKTRAQDYIVSHFSQVVQQQDFLEVAAESLETILQRDDLDVRYEECVFEALMRWARARQDERRHVLARLLSYVRLPLLEPAYFVEKVESDELIRSCSESFPLLQETRSFHLSGREVVSERTKPRARHFLSEVFLVIGGCTKDDRFIPTVTCLDPLRRSRLEVARLPGTDMEDEAHNQKWVEFACITFRNELYISGGKETQRDVWKYNGALDKWIRIEPLTIGRWRHKMAVQRGKVYALGGFDGVHRLDSVEAYDPFHNRWTQCCRYGLTGNMNSNMNCDIVKQSMRPSLGKLGRMTVSQHDKEPKHTSKMTSALLRKLMERPSMSPPDLNLTVGHPQEKGRKLEEMKEDSRCNLPKRIKGALASNGVHTKFGHALYEVYPLALAAPLAVGVSSFAAASYDKWIYVIGGGPNGKLATDLVQRWEPGTDFWEMQAPIPVETKCTNAVCFKNRIYVVGGAMHTMYCYSPLADSWTIVSRLGERASCAIAACSNKLFITGGRDNKNHVIATVMCWDVDKDVLTEECALPMGVSHHGSATLLKSYTHMQKIVPASESQ